MYEISKIKGKKIAIHVPTEELARKVMDVLVRAGQKDLMNCKDSGRSNKWTQYESRTCWDMTSQYCEKSWYQRNEYEIISAEEFLRDNEETTVYRDEELSIGDLVKGEIYHMTDPTGDWIFVFKQVNKDRVDSIGCHHQICEEQEAYYRENGLYTENTRGNRVITKASFKQRQWLMKCAQEGKFVPKEEVLPVEIKSIKQTENSMAKNGQPDHQGVVEAIAEALMGGKRKGAVNKSIVARHDLPTITIPKDMTKKEASAELIRQWEEEETIIDVARRFEGWKWQDVLVAIKITAEKHFGWINVVQSMMNPPTEIQVVIDYKDGLLVKTTCFYGVFKVAAFEAGACNIGIQGGIVGVSFNLKKKYKEQVEQWYELVDNQLRTNSIYKGKSVSVVRGGGPFGDNCSFEIIETKPNPKIVLNPKEKSILEQYCMLDLQEAGKRTYLFHGAFGNAKTESAMILGEEAKSLKMTFFYCKDSGAFIDLLGVVAKNYSSGPGALLFLEDIDEVSSGEDRDHAINELLNTLDGVQTKGKNIKVLFTTNNHGRINPALRRPGRLDLIAHFENPTEETRAKIYEIYLKEEQNLEPLNFEEISKLTPDCSGAFIAEICKRAIRLGRLNNGLTNDVVSSAIYSIKDHLALMTEPVEGGDELKNAVAVLGKVLIAGGIEMNQDQVIDAIDNLGGSLGNVHNDLVRKIGGAATDTIRKVERVEEQTTAMKPQVKQIYERVV